MEIFVVLTSPETISQMSVMSVMRQCAEEWEFRVLAVVLVEFFLFLFFLL